MEIPPLNIVCSKSHWDYTDNFGNDEYEYIKSFVHEDYTIGYHTHSFYELNIVLAGDGYHYIEDMACCAKKGSVFLIPPHIKHGYINKSNLSVYHMLIHRDFIDVCFSEFKKTEGYSLMFETEPYLRSHYNENMFLILTESQLYEICKDIDLIEKCSNQPNGNIFINAVTKKILCQLCMLITEYRGNEGEVLQSKKDLFDIAECLNYIHQNFDSKITVEYLAARLNMSRSTFIRQFKKICGCPPHQYIMDYRIEKACKSIKNKEKTHSVIAQECGFYDVSHMQKYLKKE